MNSEPDGIGWKLGREWGASESIGPSEGQPAPSTLPCSHVPARVRLTLIVALGLLFIAVAGFVAFRGGQETAGSATGFEGSLRPPDLPSPAVHRAAGRGRARPLSLARYKGQVVVMTFMYSTCKDTCPLTAQQIRGALDDLDTDVPVVAVSVDPEERHGVQRQAVPRRAADDRAHALRARPTSALRRQWDAYGIAAAARRARALGLRRARRRRAGCSGSAGPSTGSRPRAWRTTSASCRPAMTT